MTDLPALPASPLERPEPPGRPQPPEGPDRQGADDGPARPAPSGRSAPHRRAHRFGGYRRLTLAAVLGALLIGLLAGTGLGSGLGPGPGAGPADGANGTSGPGSGAGTDPGAAGTQSAAPAELPFALPSPQELRKGPHLVFAHYFPPYPLSLDNRPADSDYYSRNYLSANGEKGKHAAYGGLLRDRPEPVPPQAGDWQRANLEREVRTARDAGIDGFSVDILSLSGANWDRVTMLLDAAHAVDPEFRIMLMPDMTSLGGDQAALADALAQLAVEPSAYRLDDGRLVVSPFKAEARNTAWWTGVQDRLRQHHGIRTALVPVFLDLWAHAQEFAPISYGLSEWGNRSYTAQAGTSEDIRLAHRLGRTWMQPVSVQDARPNQGVYDEAGNTATLRGTWGHAIDDGADWVQLTTWNDYSEGSQFAPSLHNGHTYLDLSSYYLTRFKTGHWPAIVRDTVYITSRVQFAGAQDAAEQPRLMRPRKGTAEPRDTVEALSLLKAPATLDTTVGTTTRRDPVPAGVHSTLLPLRTGLATATVTRDGTTTATATTRYPVRDRIDVQDLQYYAVTSSGPDANSEDVSAADVHTEDAHAADAHAADAHAADGNAPDRAGADVGTP